jgi:hypothetical protein
MYAKHPRAFRYKTDVRGVVNAQYFHNVTLVRLHLWLEILKLRLSKETPLSKTVNTLNCGLSLRPFIQATSRKPSATLVGRRVWAHSHSSPLLNSYAHPPSLHLLS